MTPSEARELLRKNASDPGSVDPQKLAEAEWVGAGAIDRLRNLRKGFDIPHVTLLPGETEE